MNLFYILIKENRNIYSVQNLCVVKTKYDWIKKLSKFLKIYQKISKMILEKFILLANQKT